MLSGCGCSLHGVWCSSVFVGWRRWWFHHGDSVSHKVLCLNRTTQLLAIAMSFAVQISSRQNYRRNTMFGKDCMMVYAMFQKWAKVFTDTYSAVLDDSSLTAGFLKVCINQWKVCKKKDQINALIIVLMWVNSGKSTNKRYNQLNYISRCSPSFTMK